ncbi:MAG: class I SAM-dependent methyltransferase [Acidimicrobiales bacterium]
MSRVETMLTAAARSPEGLKGVHMVPTAGDSVLGIDRLHEPADLVGEFPSGSARPVVGPAVRLAKKVVRRGLRWYINPILGQQSRFNHAVLDLVERLQLHTERLATVESQQRRHESAGTESRLDALRADVEALTAALAVAAAATTAGDADAGAGAEGAGGEPSGGLVPSARRALKYRAFEDRHRGSLADITTLLAHYVPLYSGCRRVLDVGCGRGEFLTVCRDNRIGAYGVDSDESMAEAARGAGLEVVLSDAVAHLRSLSPGDIDGVFASQVAEHLDTATLMRLLEVAHRKLAPGGVIVLETPNPESLFIFAAFFYVDLTHIKPIHPEALRWALEATGFVDVEIRRILPVPDGTRLDPVPAALAADPGWATLAANTERLNNLLYGPQHFAAIGRKPLESAVPPASATGGAG